MVQTTRRYIHCDNDIHGALELAGFIIPEKDGKGNVDVCAHCYHIYKTLIFVGLIPNPRMKCDVCDRTFEVDIDTFSRIEVARDTRRSGSHGHNKKMCPSCKGEHWHAHYQQIGQWVLLYENDFDELMKETRDKVVNRLVGEQKTK